LFEVAAVSVFFVTCAPTPIFPSEIMEKADRSITFKEVLSHPAAHEGHVVEFGGEILRSMVEGENVELLIRELPVRTAPVYGPFDPGGPRGMFVIRYTGKVGVQDIQSSNLIVVIGTMVGTTITNLTGTPVRRPTVNAECFHVWRTQGNPIDDFPWTMNARYWRLIEQTYCVNRPNTILNVT
jgi:starvation-inducible outer membrane lipoprotein